MNDPVFVGESVEAALREASVTLGIPADRLRYVVLETPRAARLGIAASGARIAVILGGPTGRAATAHAGPSEPAAPEPDDPEDLEGAVLDAVDAFLDEADLDVTAELESEREGDLVLHLEGPDAPRLYERDDAVIEALEHLAARILSPEGGGPRVAVRCEGWREQREAQVRREAEEAAARVREDGQPRRLRPMNSYERWLVHVALAEQSDVRTESEGEGSERRVTVLPRVRREG